MAAMPAHDRRAKHRGQPACLPCRRRKSRCKRAEHSQTCLMCQAHETECTFSSPAPTRRRRPTTTTMQQLGDKTAADDGVARRDITTSPAAPEVTAEDDNLHILGPVMASDRRFVEAYLSGGGQAATATGPVIFFTKVQKRPVGMTAAVPSPSHSRLQTIEKLLEPWQQRVVDMYFAKVNHCFPVLDEPIPEAQHRAAAVNSAASSSPAIMSCLYAHSLVYWRRDADLSVQRCPDQRFVWNIALEALYSELHLSPGISSIVAVLLAVGGRPTTTMVGNGMLVGCAVSLAHGLGLNRDPTPWDIPGAEKHRRVRIWWCLVIHDSWSSLLYGTPPRIRHTHHDVPLPSIQPGHDGQDDGASVFEALASLTRALGLYLDRLYCVVGQGDCEETPVLDLDTWIDGLTCRVRRIIIRGTDLAAPGAANLRLCFLAAKFLHHRSELGAGTDDNGSQFRVRARRTVEEIVLFVHELTGAQLGDFWLPTTASIMSSAATFLVRLAIQNDESLSLSLARGLMTSLRSHRDRHGWDLADPCLSQFADLVDGLSAQQQQPLEYAHGGTDAAFLEELMADPWDALLWEDGVASHV